MKTMNEIQGIARLKIHDGKLEEFKRVSSQCTEVARTKDTGTLQYELYFNKDQTECLVLERYRDSQSRHTHGCHAQDVHCSWRVVRECIT